MNFGDTTDQEILNQLQTAQLADKLNNSDEWKLVKEAMKRTYDGHIMKLRKADPTKPEAIMELQQICNLYAEDFLPRLINNFQETAAFYHEEAKKKNLLSFMDKIKNWA